MLTPQSEETDPIQPEWTHFQSDREGISKLLKIWSTRKYKPCKHVQFQSFLPGWNTFLALARPTWQYRQKKKTHGRLIQLFCWRSQRRRLIVERLKTTSSSNECLKRWRKQDSTEPLTESRTAGEVWRQPTNVTRLNVKTSKRFGPRLTRRWSNVERLWRTGLATKWMWGLRITPLRLLFLLKRTAALLVGSILPANITTLATRADRQHKLIIILINWIFQTSTTTITPMF